MAESQKLPSERADYESTPLSRSEYIAAIVHLYRGELYRANSWRIRLDNTTNWAVLTTAGLLTFSFDPVGHTHWILLIGVALISFFLFFEARRFRFADVWRARVRMIEENFYGPILRRDPVSPTRQWGEWVADDLFHPRFKLSTLEAVRVRFQRTYWALYLALLFGWSIKVVSSPAPAQSVLDVKRNLALGLLPWWLPLVYIVVFFGLVVLLLVHTRQMVHSEIEHWERELPRRKDRATIDW
jgi:uncharacterized membrane protein